MTNTWKLPLTGMGVGLGVALILILPAGGWLAWRHARSASAAMNGQAADAVAQAVDAPAPPPKAVKAKRRDHHDARHERWASLAVTRVRLGPQVRQILDHRISPLYPVATAAQARALSGRLARARFDLESMDDGYAPRRLLAARAAMLAADENLLDWLARHPGGWTVSRGAGGSATVVVRDRALLARTRALNQSCAQAARKAMMASRDG